MLWGVGVDVVGEGEVGYISVDSWGEASGVGCSVDC